MKSMITCLSKSFQVSIIKNIKVLSKLYRLHGMDSMIWNHTLITMFGVLGQQSIQMNVA